MGLLKNLRHELVDIIEWIDHTRDTLAWRFPRFRNEIKHGARLIVRPGQVAVFVHRGKLADVFEPGDHTLKTGNLPLLSTIAGWKHGFESGFKSEVYFINTRQITELKWGTPNPIMFRDPDFGPLRIRAFGIYSLKTADPRRLMEELVGTDEVFEVDEIFELMRGMINNAFADIIGESKLGALDFAANYQELSDELRQKVVEQVDDAYGLSIPVLKVLNISLPEEVEEALDVRNRMAVIGDMNRFYQYQMAQSLPELAANAGGGVAASGMGLGLGIGMAGQMMNSMAPAAQGFLAPPALPAAAPTFHIANDGKTEGPLTMVQLQQAITEGRLTKDTLVWTTGMEAWSPAGQVPHLSGAFGPPPLPGR